ncbi:hypothetical protein NUBL21975_29650 [Klebsiella pneumoniae]|nr:hypothetical protein NUBL21975_29650 [Klebsiella pneumoniae]
MQRIVIIANGAAYGSESLFNSLRLAIALREQQSDLDAGGSAALFESQHASRLAGTTAPGGQPQAKRAVPARQRAGAGLAIIERRVPDKRTVAKDPY